VLSRKFLQLGGSFAAQFILILGHDRQVVLAPKSDNVSKAERGLPQDVALPVPLVTVVSSCEPQNVVSRDVGSPSRSDVQNTHNEPLEDQTCVLSESSLLVSDSLRIFARWISRPQSNTKFEKSSSNCDTAVETKDLRGDEAASLEISKNGNGQEAFPQQVAAGSNVQLRDKLFENRTCW